MYSPNIPPDDKEEFTRYTYDELTKLNDNIVNGQESFKLDELNAAPPRPRNGLVVYADGTNWNPGSGEGFYGYVNGAWVKL